MTNREVTIENSWKIALQEEFNKSYFNDIRTFLHTEKDKGRIIYPPGNKIFNAFNITPLPEVKVVILGQDPYHGPGQAMGLSFSVPQNIRIPPSLRNIYKEINIDLNIPIPKHGDLSSWAKQGVFLLNAILTVEHKKAGSHKKIGWETFTDAVIRLLSEKADHIVFMLWGNFARSKSPYIDHNKHLILESFHPSPLAGNGFFHNHHFSQANDFLAQHGKTPIDWSISS